MRNEKKKQKGESVYSIRLRAGKRRTYFFDVRPTRADDFYITITESKKRFDDKGYDRHKLFLYKEDFNKFVDALQKTLDHIKENLLPDYDFDEFTREIGDDQIQAVPVDEVLQEMGQDEDDEAYDLDDDEDAGQTGDEEDTLSASDIMDEDVEDTNTSAEDDHSDEDEEGDEAVEKW